MSGPALSSLSWLSPTWLSPTWLSPPWLAALAALLLPLALHLLARGHAARRRVGSVQLLAAAAAQQPRRLALRQPLLLLLRCLLLAALALALAGPRLPATPAAGGAPPRPWLLVEPGLTGAVPAVLRAAGAGGERPEERWLAPGLPPHDARRRAAAPGAAGDTAAALADPALVPGGLWSLLREAAALAPAGAELRVVTSGRLATLAGERPVLTRAVRWHLVIDGRTNHWIARAPRRGDQPAAADANGVLVAASDRQRTTFVPRAAGDVEGAGGTLHLRGPDAVPADDTLAPPPAGGALPVLLIAAADREEDARYLAAALRAAAAEAGLTVELLRSLPDAAAAARSPLAFWLGDTPPPAELLAGLATDATLVLDRALPEASCGGAFAVAGTIARVALRRCGGDPAGESGLVPALWRSDRGRAVLVVERAAAPRTLRLRGRFHPAWSDLVVSPALPSWLFAELTAARATPSAELPLSDRRGDGGQGAPALAAHERAATRTPATTSRALERALWLALPLLLVAERWLAGRRR